MCSVSEWCLSLMSFSDLGDSGKACNVEDCLRSFTDEEILDGRENYFCSKCKNHTKATKTLRVQRFPKILVLHLKRFSFTEFSREKIRTNVSFPLHYLNMKPFSADEQVAMNLPPYDLFAVGQHMGSLDGGHYVATCWNDGDGEWYVWHGCLICIQSNSLTGLLKALHDGKALLPALSVSSMRLSVEMHSVLQVYIQCLTCRTSAKRDGLLGKRLLSVIQTQRVAHRLIQSVHYIHVH